ncbi:FecR domain-containing protein [Candidatus Sumerlaeota bacterium]|nr:FecR domain-containing protein [Candidatus Sumerlaeota bacterium]
MMFHPRLKTISKFLDNLVSDSKAKKLIRHINTCKNCEETVDILRNVEGMVNLNKHLDESITNAITSQLPEIRRNRQSVAGVIRGVIGTVAIFPPYGEEGEEGFIGMGLKQGDTVKLAEKSMVLIELTDGSSLWLNTNTEINFKSGDHKLALKAGEIFAMMKPQREPFMIKTPSAVLSVIGTNFDARIKDGEKTVLSVLKGKVSFRNNKGETIVKKGRQVEADNNSKLMQLRITDPGSIYGWTTSMTVSGKKGKTSLKSLSFLSLFIILLVFGIILAKGRNHSNDLLSGSGNSSFNANEPFGLKSPYLQKGLSWRTSIVKKIRKNPSANFTDFLEIDLVTEILDVDPQKGGHAVVTVEDVRLQKPTDGRNTGIAEIDNPEQENLSGVVNMKERKLEYYFSADGAVQSLEINDGKTIASDELRIWGYVILDNHFNMLFPANPVSPGDKWNAKIDLNIPGYPGSYVRRRDQVNFAGYENHNNRMTAVFRSRYDITIGGGIKIFSLVRGNAEQAKILDEIFMNGATNYYIDVQNGRLVNCMGNDFEKNIKGRIEFSAPGSPVQSQTIEEKLNTEYTNNITIEYISNE